MHVPRGPTDRSGRPATLADVARRAGVSAMTVSRVVNGEGAVRPSTRERVLAAVAELNYVPLQAARRPAEPEPIRIGVLYSNPSAGYLSEFLIGLINESTHCGVQLVVEWLEPSRAAEVAAPFLGSGFDAVVLAPPLSDSAALVDRVLEQGLLAMQVAPRAPDARASAVGVDHRGAARRMTEHLIALGHERIGFITGSAAHSASAGRLDGFREALQAAGLPVPEELVAVGQFTYSSGLAAAEALLAAPQRPTAVFAGNDDMAAATVAVAHRLGLDVPADLTVVGCDDTTMATSTRPQLTTIRQPIRAMAATAVSLLAEQVRARRLGEHPAPRVVHMDCELVRRQSDAAPRRRKVADVRPARRVLMRG